MLERNELYVKVEARAFKISSHSGKLSKTYIEELSRHQEEAGKKMFLAAHFLFELGFVKVNIIAIDTDVAVLAIYYQSILEGSIYREYRTLTKTQKCNISSHSQGESLSKLYLASML